MTTSITDASAIINEQFNDVFSVLGMHKNEQSQSLIVNCFLPGASQVEVIDLKSNRKVAQLNAEDQTGYFSGVIPRRKNPFAYQLRAQYPHSLELINDPYQYPSPLSEQDVYLFNEGSQLQAYQFQGANWRELAAANGEHTHGVHFCVWAPNAKRVAVVGDFNYWHGERHMMRFHPASGLWDIFIPEVEAGQLYKFQLINQQGELVEKADPYAKGMQGAPGNASVVPPKEAYQWQDDDWLAKRAAVASHKSPMSTYEVHLASWRRVGDNGEQYYQYQKLIDELIPYVVEMGFSHIQLMPISEYPFDGSWGYQPVGLFAPTQRMGDAVGLKAFVDACHGNDIAVLLDWVPAHFPKDHHGLARFDGSCLYEHADPRQGEHPDWDTLIFNYGRAEVQSFLLSNAHYWLSEFHFDGLRLDAVSSMLYLDYSREQGQWLPNEHGGRENLSAIAFLKQLNSSMYREFPGICMIAEESTAWGGVTKPVSDDGLGFGYKWNMGWMNDTLGYLRRDPIYRRHHHHEMTFSLVYAHTEQFILSLSHDEVVHGKAALISKIPGDDWQKFATLRAYYGFMWSHPGKQLLFMGGEFAQRDEWNHNYSLDWHLLQYAPHQGVQDWVRDLNAFYHQTPALFEADFEPSGFQWLDCHNADNSVFVYLRFCEQKQTHVLVVVNMTPQVHHGFRVGLPNNEAYVEVLNSDDKHYGGSHVVNEHTVEPEAQRWQEQAQSALISVPPLGCCYLIPASQTQLSNQEGQANSDKHATSEVKLEAVSKTEAAKTKATKTTANKSKATKTKSTESTTKSKAVSSTASKSKTASKTNAVNKTKSTSAKSKAKTNSKAKTAVKPSNGKGA
ncbi:1,4-alpha-glucan branching protein GlgB [Shewanella sp. WXL01]|uniref:1,4-alpha-glucan branching protein GlgB n=1 Tax=Shewanella sp. WXL01 TaxID=2709721 RepID=UPI0014384DCF|nr:1,4-alpha-glucan branching protein GlgB [Shewanella sp. WXL01]NKF51069.1 1,4-alpha-glucan branching protein GlgB [Shewanella sp. WXL01]